jgi:hypothetical protein
MVEAEIRQAIVDGEHVKILSIAYLVSTGLSVCVSMLGLLYAFMGVFFAHALTQVPAASGQVPPPEAFGWIFTVFGAGIFVAMNTFALLKYMTYRRLKQHRSRVFCMVVAGLSCLFIPYGTLLGIFTFIVLTRPSVVHMFSVQPPPIEAAALRGSGG